MPVYQELAGLSDQVITANFVPLTRSPCDDESDAAVCDVNRSGPYGSLPTVKKYAAAGAFPEIYSIRGRLYVNRTALAAHDAAILARINGKAAA